LAYQRQTEAALLVISTKGKRMTHTVRQATIRDLEQLVPLFDGYREFYGRASDLRAAREFLLARFNNDESTVFIAHEDENAIGFTQLYPSFSSISLARIFVLNDLFVHEQARRKGVASALMSAAVKFATALGADRLSLSTAITNAAAQALYQSAGWKREDQFLVYDLAIPT
jgi:ribosomal protein S18 acetylase RimI-like enzyme